jgi:hypothetical protein
MISIVPQNGGKNKRGKISTSIHALVTLGHNIGFTLSLPHYAIVHSIDLLT